MTTNYSVKLSVHLRPIWHASPPEINIGIDNNVEKITLLDNQIFHYEFTANHAASLNIELLNKTDADTIPDKGLDKAVVIESVSFFGISDPRFVWLGVYKPNYPEPWATEQQNAGIVLAPALTGHNYLSWNGKWTLDFTVPVFTWIHRVQNLGWIYD
jgi:hypothetical protein